jgi:hypothetical protein
MSGEPLVQGMLVGTEKDLMTPSELHQVSVIHRVATPSPS